MTQRAISSGTKMYYGAIFEELAFYLVILMCNQSPAPFTKLAKSDGDIGRHNSLLSCSASLGVVLISQKLPISTKQYPAP